MIWWKNGLDAEYVKYWHEDLVYKTFSSSPPKSYKGTSSGWKNGLDAEYVKYWHEDLVYKPFSSSPKSYKGTSSGWKNGLDAEYSCQEKERASSGG